ncbi:DUF2339 domain-containing protein [Saccharothrix longispora]|uniref:DUF2339 domain-containing protein n=1 Tax=Saccharothrix longispora TaxID=33920 RepID=UPI0028FD538A|nr:DUF2339 domain-containing protein [Saccharothrix longispora]MBY8848596.1 DUF2339 domain-containing protein [Saccharothrix sp. MB29]MDU0288467.1 DUF2339 domain-containing protein [Saccharothrix longispora]
MTGTGHDPLIRLADELSHLGRRLEAVGRELHRVGDDRAVATLERPADAATTRAETPEPKAPQSKAPQPKAPPVEAAEVEAARVQPPPVQQPPVQPQQVQPPVQRQPIGPEPVRPPFQTGSMPPPPPHPGHGWGPPPQWTPPPPRRSLFDRLSQDGAGSKLLAWVGGAVTLLGVVMLLVLAVQRGYLGPLPRVLGGAALGGVLVGVGLWLHRTPAGRTGAFALAATGIAVLYLDVVAATSIYSYLPEGGGLAAGLVIAAGGLLLAAKWDSPVLAIGVVAACAVCAPILTAGFTPLLVGFLLVLKTAATPVHLKRAWPWLAVTAGVPPLVATVLVIGRTDQHVLAAIALLAAVVGVAGAVLTARVRPDDLTALALAVGSPVPALLTVSVLDRHLGAAVAGAVALVLLALWAVGRRSLPRAFTAGIGAVGVFAAFQATAVALDGSTRAAVVLLEALVLAVLAKLLTSRGPLIGSAAFAAVGTLLTLAHAVPPELLLDEPRRAATVGFLVSGVLTALVLGVLAVVLPWVASGLGVLGRHPLPWVVAGVVLLYAAAGVVLCGALLVSQDVTGFVFGHSVVTVSWTVAALFLLVKGIDRRAVRVAGLVLVGAAVAKLLLFDLAALDGIARVLAFIGAGLVLLTAGTRYAKLVATRRISADS